MLSATAVDIYELLKPKLGQDESKYLIHFIEDRTVSLVQEEIAKGVATKEDIAKLDQKITNLEKELLDFKWQIRLYVVILGALILVTNPKVLDLVGKLLGIVPK
ncbi:MAG: hypothetical protein QME81_11695 [bacterium]|nr:hypothetical protein [bacterium]